MAKLDYKQEASRQVCELLDNGKLTTDLLTEWLDGFSWHWEPWAEPYRMILDSLPLRSQQMPRYRDRLAKVAARLLEELADKGGYPAANFSHNALGELFFLCACLASSTILADPLEAYYKTVSAKGIDSLDHTERVALRLAVERNQADDRLSEVWMQMIEGKEGYLPGSWEHGFDALGRCLHTRIQEAEDVESTSITLIPVFRRALHSAQESALKSAGGEVAAAAERISKALDYWEVSCPGLRRPLLVFLFDSLYQQGTSEWLKEILEQRLSRAEVPLLDRMVSVASGIYSPEQQQPIDQKQLAKMTLDSLKEASLSIVTARRLLSLVSQLAARCASSFSAASPSQAMGASSRPGDYSRKGDNRLMERNKPIKPARRVDMEPVELSKLTMVGAEACDCM